MKRIICIGLCLILLLAASGCAASKSEQQASPSAYRLLIGLADADTGKQELTVEEAVALCESTFAKAGIGYTLYEGRGGYPTDDEFISNGTIIVEMLDVSTEAAYGVMNLLFEDLNISAISIVNDSIKSFDLVFHP